MHSVRLIHWNADESAERARRLEACGYEVDFAPLDGPPALRRMRDEPPSAVVIDLSRLPSQGRDVGVAIRKYKSTRCVPLVFVDGDKEKVDRVRQLLPDAVYASWSGIRRTLKKAIRQPPTDPVVPDSAMAAYSSTPLPKKLGIKAGSVVVLVSAPPDFEKTLGQLPEGVRLRRQARGANDLVVWFAKSLKDVQRRIKRMGDLAGKGGLWIAWPKKSADVVTDLSQPVVRKMGLASGLVDYKVCSIDATWTGLRFTRRVRGSRARKQH